MFRVYIENSELLLEDCRAGANGWLRLSLNPQLENPSDAPSVVLEKVVSVADEQHQESSFQSVHAIYGIYHFLSGPFLAVITDSRVIGSGPNSEKIYCIQQVDLLPVSGSAHRSFMKHASKREKQDERAYCRMIKSTLASRTFYFSYELDLTLSAQKRNTNKWSSSMIPISSSSSTSLPPMPVAAANVPTLGVPTGTSMWQTAEEDFFWNKPVMQPFMDMELDSWIIPVISGFVKVVKKCEINGMRCDLLLFTRRSWRRVGTRFNVRGVDKDGHVANFAETEAMIVKPNRSICSYVQIRGSIPLYWDQLVTLKYMPRTRYAFSSAESIVDWNELAFRSHMDNIIRRYGHITVVNLIDRTGKSKTVRDQAQLGSAFAKYVKKYNQSLQTSDPSAIQKSPLSSQPKTDATGVEQSTSLAVNPFSEPVKYVWFDFHHECRKMKWGNLSKLMEEVNDQFSQYGWFECDSEGRELSKQKGVFRVNCMDNLDRTNVVMSLFARRTSLMALNLYNDQARANILDSPYEAFETVFKNAWADNADYVSKMYAGTGALKTDFTRTGKRTLAGAIQDGINSVTRYYLNNFCDGVRQDSYDLLVGNFAPDKREDSPFTFQQRHSFLNFMLEMSLIGMVIVSASVSVRAVEEYHIRVRDGLIATVAIGLVTTHLILKKGMFRALGRRYVCKPSFCSSGYIKRKEA